MIFKNRSCQHIIESKWEKPLGKSSSRGRGTSGRPRSCSQSSRLCSRLETNEQKKYNNDRLNGEKDKNDKIL